MNGVFKRKWGTFGTGDNQYQYVTGLDVYNDEGFIVDNVNARIQVTDLLGNYKRQWGSFGSGNGQFNDHDHIKIYGDKTFVTDSANNRIQKFDLDGNFDKRWNSANPIGVYIYNNEVYIAELSNPKIRVTDLNGNYKRMIGSEGIGDGQFKHPNQPFVDASGVYVPDGELHRIQVFGF